MTETYYTMRTKILHESNATECPCQAIFFQVLRQECALRVVPMLLTASCVRRIVTMGIIDETNISYSIAFGAAPHSHPGDLALLDRPQDHGRFFGDQFDPRPSDHLVRAVVHRGNFLSDDLSNHQLHRLDNFTADREVG